ncbi:MAG: hypothetical protein HYX92_17740 [Chloroflexi bacterium]|nr:hypothetical protein [Chloroflexota bacterium]
MGTRRSLIAVLTVLGLLLAACAPAAAPTPKPALPSPAPTKVGAATPEAKPAAPAATPKPAGETPKYGGIFTTTVTNMASLDPQQDTGAVYMNVAPMYTTLVQGHPLTNDKIVPGLAEKWEMSQDGLAWTFDIRQGVKFHDGTPFTIDDAVFSVKRLADPPRGIVSNAAYLLKPVVKSIDKEGNKLKMALSSPFALLLDTLGLSHSAIYSQKYVEQHGDMKRTAMGTGPFKFKAYTPGTILEGVKNLDFWVKGRPYLDGYRVLIISDPATRLAAFRTGKINRTGKTTYALTPTEMETVAKDNPALKFYPSASVNGAWFFLNTRRPPFQDQRVRTAVHLALDRQAAIKVLAKGKGLLGQPLPLDPWAIPEAELVKMPGYRQPKDADIQDAKRLMREAGYADGFDLAIWARQQWQSRESAVFMTNQLAAIGVRAKVQVVGDAEFWETGRQARHEAMSYTSVFFTPDPQWGGRSWAPGGTLNFSGNEDDKELARMFDEQIKILDLAQRKALIRKMAEHLLNALPAMPVVWHQVFIGAGPEVRNFTPGISDYLANTLEEIWLAK